MEMGVVNENDLSAMLDSPLTNDSSDEERGNLETQVFDLVEHQKKLLKETREVRNEKKKEKKKRDYLHEKEQKRKKWAVGTRKLTDLGFRINQ